VIIQLVARFERKAVDAGGIGQEVELQSVIVAAAFSSSAQDLSGQDNGRFATKFDYFLNRVRAPCTQPGDHNISRLSTAVCHRFQNPALRRLFMPIESAFFPQIDVSDQEDGDVNKHLYEAVDSKAV
jgi:hypothetical protein